MKTVKKNEIEENDLISSKRKKEFLPNYRTDQLFDLSEGISCLFSQMACSQSSETTNPEIDKAEWQGIYQVAVLQYDVMKEIRTRVPGTLTDSIDIELNEGGH